MRRRASWPKRLRAWRAWKGAEIRYRFALSLRGLAPIMGAVEAFALVASINTSTNASSYPSGTASPAADRFLLAFVSATGSAIQPTVPTPSGWGLTWSQVGTSHAYFTGSNGAGIWVFGAKTTTAPGSGSFTADFGSQAMLGCEGVIVAVSGHDLNATVAQLVVQFVKSTPDASGTTSSLTLAAASGADNRPVAYFVHHAAEGTNFRTNWTETWDSGGHVAPTRGAQCQTRADAFETTASADWTTSTNFGGVALEVKAASTGQTVAAGQTTETDTSQALAKIKTKAVGQNAETDTPQALTRVKTKALGEPSDTEVAQPVTWAPKNRLANLASEGDIAQPVSALKTKSIGQVVETDEAPAFNRAKVAPLGQTVETDIAQAAIPLKTAVIGQTSEVDAAQPLGKAKSAAVGETSEAETSQPVVPRKTLALGQATETDLAQIVTPVMGGGGQTIVVGQAAETDTAQALTSLKAKALGQASETDTVHALGASKRAALGQATQSEIAQPIEASKAKAVGLVVEPDSAAAIAVLKTIGITQSIELDAALALTLRRTYVIGQATETDSVFPIALLGAGTGASPQVGTIRRQSTSGALARSAGGPGVRRRSGTGTIERDASTHEVRRSQ